MDRRTKAQVQAYLHETSQERAQRYDRRTLELVKRVLPIMADSKPALQPEAELADGLAGSRALEEAQAALYKGDFRQAERLLTTAMIKGAHPERLKEVQRLRDNLKTAYLAANIYPIRDLIRNHKFEEAFQRIDTELHKNLSGDLEAELLGLEADIFREQPEQALAWTQNLLRIAQSENDFALIEKALTVVLGSLRTFPQRTQAQNLRRQATIGQLDARLELIELALRHRLARTADTPSSSTLPLPVLWQLDEAPQTLEEAKRWATDLVEQAQAHKPPLIGIARRARQLVDRIDELTPTP